MYLPIFSSVLFQPLFPEPHFFSMTMSSCSGSAQWPQHSTEAAFAKVIHGSPKVKCLGHLCASFNSFFWEIWHAGPFPLHTGPGLLCHQLLPAPPSLSGESFSASFAPPLCLHSGVPLDALLVSPQAEAHSDYSQPVSPAELPPFLLLPHKSYLQLLIWASNDLSNLSYNLDIAQVLKTKHHKLNFLVTCSSFCKPCLSSRHHHPTRWASWTHLPATPPLHVQSHHTVWMFSL